jgi:ABC-type multidrug transport system ATPase subunit
MGQRQRLRLALALLHEPALLLFDEPWSSLDDEGLVLLSDAVKDFAARGGAAIFCAPAGHDLDLVPADCVYALDQGRLVQA